MAVQFRIKLNSTFPSLTVQLFDENGDPQDLATNVDSVSYLFEPVDAAEGDAPTTRACVVTDAAKGKCRVDWQSADVDAVGEFNGEFVVSFTTGEIKIFPSAGYFTFEVTDAVD